MKEIIAPEEGFTVQNLAAVVAILQPALRTSIEALAERNEGAEWFDTLEKRLIRDAKGTITEGISIETEASGLKLGIDVLQATLNACRNSLGLARKDD